MLQHIEPPRSSQAANPSGLALFKLGFRPAFLCAVSFAWLALAWWYATLIQGRDWMSPGATLSAPISAQVSLTQWHGHAMLFGFAFAVIAGFLLTAVRNWTGVPTARGWALAGLFACWLLARAALACGSALGFTSGQTLGLAALGDLGFVVGLVAVLSRSILRARQTQQMFIVLKVALLGVANALFYLGAWGALEHGARWGLASALYLILALIFTLARRVLPMYIKGALGLQQPLPNTRALDLASLYLLLALLVSDVYGQADWATRLIALALFVVHGWRLAVWHVRALWRHPMLWSLVVAYGFATLGFLLLALGETYVPRTLAIHAFTAGGIGLMTFGMMTRVTLGHTGRFVESPPATIKWVFLLLALGAVLRVFGPLADSAHTVLWWQLALLCWLVALPLWLISMTPMLLRPRLDGQAE